jgi:hypothetical protein
MQTPRKLPADWTDVLARVEQALGLAIANIESREKALADSPQFAPIAKPLNFTRFDERLAALAACQLPADEQLAQLDADLGAGELAARQWLSHAEASRKQLAAWVGRAVG